MNACRLATDFVKGEGRWEASTYSFKCEVIEGLRTKLTNLWTYHRESPHPPRARLSVVSFIFCREYSNRARLSVGIEIVAAMI
jgi:hypothetical protein